MKIPFVFLLLCLSVAAHGLIFSADTSLRPTQPAQTQFNASTYIDAYLANSPEVAAEKNSLRMAQNTYKNAFSDAFLPSFSVSATADKTYSRPDKVRTWEEFRHFYSSAQGNAQWNLLNSGKDMLAYKSASLSFQQAKLSFEKFIQQTVLDAVKTYYDLLLSKKLLNVYQEDLEIARKQYEQDKVLYDNGLKTHSDLLASETNYRSSQLSLFTAQNDYSNALKNFNIALNQPLETEVILDETLQANLPPLPDLNTDLTRAMAQRYDVRLRRLQLRRENVQLTREKLDTLPSVFLDLFANTGRALHQHEWWDYNYGVSAGITFDLGFFYLNKYRQRQNIRWAQEKNHLEFEQFLRSVRDNVVEARNALLLKQQSLEISNLRLQAAKQKFEATQRKYKNGLMSATDLTVARSEMISAQVNYATLTSELTLTLLRYRYAVGETIYEVSTEDL